ncbi:uroporphyrinogen-III C-methyltransferase [Halalkalibacter akibai]|uniref:Uroporphyrinogen-III C-methyltransferase n=1 Tax=Halalkalibacter akibai (strain ATCC 43226 / DSM 21942 / CIP 109018 / JCM 9157 / 1139) TaxID=1236973 RepID=W4QYN4_HALA3|nr:uroporphyrinogen-III C-methyltransferase [Halalkalibacter akibai]GAE37196.1 uroporphyrinogen-III methyltransferase [Halalkalibacter akibai JCM 9157]
MNRGMVYFVGAGPGDIDLITVKGKKALQQADVVIFDRLINPFLLTEVRADAKLIYCGKQPCKHTLRQEDIQTEILIHARKGKTVVRLKGGDPAVFGRVGEEAELLAEHQIQYEIIPGITAGIAATMYSGVPITHRKHSNSFAVVTGHGSQKDGTPNINWGNLAKGVETIIFYMGVKHLKTITTELISHGKSRETQALVVQWGTYSKQKTVTGSLATIANKVQQENITNPAIILVGNVAKLRDKLVWFDQRILSGKSFFIPSQSIANEQIVLELKKHGADVYEHQLFSESCEYKLGASEQLKPVLRNHQLLILSPQSAKQFVQTIGENGMDLRSIESTIYSVDDTVRMTLRQNGIQSTVFNKKNLSAAVLIGSDLEIENFKHHFNEATIQLALTKSTVTQKDIEAFARLIEEQHVNTLLFTKRIEALKFLTFLTNSGLTKTEIKAATEIICTDQEAKHLLEQNGMRVNLLIDDVRSLLELNESVVLAKES